MNDRLRVTTERDSELVRRRLWRLVILAVTIAGCTARLWNLDFDNRQHQNPDERHWALTAAAIDRAPSPIRSEGPFAPLIDWVDGQKSGANPYRGTDFFVYGPSMLPLTRMVAGLMADGVKSGAEPGLFVVRVLNSIGVPLLDSNGSPRFDDAYNSDLIGRLLGALLDSLTILVVAVIGRRIGGKRVGFVAAIFQASSVLSIQYAHFFGAEPLAQLTCALTLWASLRLAGDTRKRFALLAGVCSGLALASKLSTVGLLLVPGALLVWQLLVADNSLTNSLANSGESRRWWRLRYREVARLVMFVGGVALSFRIAYPSAFVGLGMRPNPQAIENYRLLRSMGSADLPPAVQWAARIPILDPLKNLAFYAVGPGTSVGAILGAISLWRRWGRSRIPMGVPIIAGAVLIPFLAAAVQFSPTSRYFVPMLPALHVLGGFSVWAFFRKPTVGIDPLQELSGRLRRRVDVVVPGKSPFRLGSEGAPMPSSNQAIARLAVFCMGASILWSFAFVQGVYGHPNTRVLASRWIAKNVAKGSVLSNEGWDDALPLSVDGIDPTAWRSERFDLFGPDSAPKVERLAQQISKTDYIVESSPRVWKTVRRIPARFPSTIRFFDALDAKKLGFERVATFRSSPRIGPLGFNDSQAEEAFSVYDHPEVRIWKLDHRLEVSEIQRVLGIERSALALAITPQNAHANGLQMRPSEQVANSTGSSFREAFSNDGKGVWQAVFWLALLELLGLAAFSMLVAVLRFLPDAGFGVAKLGGLVIVGVPLWIVVAWGWLSLSRSLVVAWIAVVLLAGACGARRNRRILRSVWTERRRTLCVVELITLAGFCLMLAVRSANPDLWHPFRGGEKPFEMAFFTAVLRTKTLPPYDPWFSGGVQNYYYGGWFLVSTLARVFRTSPAVAFNLALAVFASLTTGAAFSVSAALSTPLRQTDRLAKPLDLPRSARAQSFGGLLGVFLLLGGSNAAAIKEVVRSLGARSLQRDWWSFSRVIPNSTAITEFPGWSLLFGDLHPHLMDIAIVCGLMTFCLAFVNLSIERLSSFEAGADAEITRPGLVRSFGWGCCFGLLLGLVRATNTWDFPISCLVVVSSIAWVCWKQLAFDRRLSRLKNFHGGAHWWRSAVGSFAGICFALFVCWGPYTWRGEVFDAGVLRNREVTPLGSWLTQFGWFAAVTLFVGLSAFWTASQTPMNYERLTRGAGLVLLGLGALVLGVNHQVFVADVVLALVSLRIALRRGQSSDSHPAAALLLMCGWGLGACVELLTVMNDNGRQNTVFKFWYQMWILLALGSAGLLVTSLREIQSLRLPPLGKPESPNFDVLAENMGISSQNRKHVSSLATVLLFVSFLFSASFFGISLGARLSDRVSTGPKTLDGLSFLSTGLEINENGTAIRPSQDRQALKWLQENVHGLVTIAEAPGIGYGWRSRISWLTGLPTVLGWPYHESQQRRGYGASIEQRQSDLLILFTSPVASEVRTVLRRYSIRYVILGSEERAFAKPEGFGAILKLDCVNSIPLSPQSSEEPTVALLAVSADCSV